MNRCAVSWKHPVKMFKCEKLDNRMKCDHFKPDTVIPRDVTKVHPCEWNFDGTCIEEKARAEALAEADVIDKLEDI